MQYDVMARNVGSSVFHGVDCGAEKNAPAPFFFEPSMQTCQEAVARWGKRAETELARLGRRALKAYLRLWNVEWLHYQDQELFPKPELLYQAAMVFGKRLPWVLARLKNDVMDNHINRRQNRYFPEILDQDSEGSFEVTFCEEWWDYEKYPGEYFMGLLQGLLKSIQSGQKFEAALLELNKPFPSIREDYPNECQQFLNLPGLSVEQKEFLLDKGWTVLISPKLGIAPMADRSILLSGHGWHILYDSTWQQRLLEVTAEFDPEELANALAGYTRKNLVYFQKVDANTFKVIAIS